jgi:predicted RNA-binding Zn-ribbon protein involved in translation (DUF1610 family)
MALTNLDKTTHLLLHVHGCVHCGGLIRREELEGRGHTTGIFSCPKCGVEGPLNLVISEVNGSPPTPPVSQ